MPANSRELTHLQLETKLKDLCDVLPSQTGKMKLSLSHPLHAMLYSLTLSKMDTFGTGPMKGDLSSSSYTILGTDPYCPSRRGVRLILPILSRS